MHNFLSAALAVALCLTSASARADDPCDCKGDLTNSDGLAAAIECLRVQTFGVVSGDRASELEKKYFGEAWSEKGVTAPSPIKATDLLLLYFGDAAYEADGESPGWKAEQVCNALYEDVDAAAAAVAAAAK